MKQHDVLHRVWRTSMFVEQRESKARHSANEAESGYIGNPVCGQIALGDDVGDMDGTEVVGPTVGDMEGKDVVGETVGAIVGDDVGVVEGLDVVGDTVGETDGAEMEGD